MTTKSYFLIPMMLIIIGLLTSCSNNNDWNRFGLNGKVKTYLEQYYEAEVKFGEWEKGDIQFIGHSRTSFDNDGNYKWVEYLDEDNELFYKCIPKRENGELIEEVVYDEDGKLINKSKFFRNSNDEQEFIQYDKDGVKTAQGKLYIENNLVIRQQIQIFEEKKVKEEYSDVFEYDKDGNTIGQKKSDINGEIIGNINYKYLAFDEKKNWTKRLYYVDGVPTSIVIREYEYY